jgi:F0F1-type ATP synthase membrane subunit c/vacuolar-type H+-ATPase subunit K
MNVYASAGSAAKAQIELAGLFNQARKMVSENQLGSQNAQEKDMAAGKSLANKLAMQETSAQKVKVGLQYAKIGLAVIKLVGSAVAAGNSKEKDGTNQTGKVKDKDGKTTDLKTTNPSDAAKGQANASAWIGAAVAVGQQVVAAINAAADQEKAKKNRNTLKAEDAGLTADMNALAESGRA